MREQVLLQPTYILHRIPYRNTSVLLECLTRDYGRVMVVARGARAPRFRSKGLLQPFYPLTLSWGGRHSEWVYLNKVEGTQAPFLFTGLVLSSALYLNELLVRLLKHRDPHPDVFSYYQDTLNALSEAPKIEPPLRIFEKNLLKAIGYGLNLSTDHVSGEALRANSLYRFFPERGFCEISDFHKVQVSEWECFKGASLLALASERLEEPIALSDAKRLMRRVLRNYLGGRDVQSRFLVQKK
ncbi:MAG: DNA repair protein RecO [Gammaproteobacteria bacterium]|nr:DNA repair protein RecO [Gammaproteobacteria bacterium]